ncbi:succinate dehydrogenase [Candidatus Nitromaritima sp. SCGC AAA799-C22]|nr:succinate dehydrogenase [Candidatus Nitromaritima sp. SCGC AAA799-C22]
MDKRTKDQIHYLLLKTHSLTGLIPVGAFLALHLSVNSLRTVGVWPYQLSIDVINNLPFLIWIEIGFIYIPILFHSLMGFYIYHTGCSNVFRYRYPRNWMYLAQRMSGAVVFVFLCYHMYTTVVPKLLYGHSHFEAAPFLIDVMNDEFKSWGGRIIYAIGIISATFHFANGLWGFCMSWGLIVGRRAQTNAGYVFVLVGLALTIVGLATVAEFSLHPVGVEATQPG